MNQTVHIFTSWDGSPSFHRAWLPDAPAPWFASGIYALFPDNLAVLDPAPAIAGEDASFGEDSRVWKAGRGYRSLGHFRVSTARRVMR
jgi:hypothetical protein